MPSKILQYLFIYIFFTTACHSNENPPVKKVAALRTFSKAEKHKIDSTRVLLTDGCIVLRRGNDIISEMFSMFNKTDQSFSHCGIAFNENNTWYVYHSIGGEDNPDERLRKDTYENFIIPIHNSGFGICNLSLTTPVIAKLHRIVDSLYLKKVPFDMKFDLESNDRLYCAEMVYKSVQTAMGNDTLFSRTIHNGFQFVSTDNIFVNKHAQIVCRVKY